MRSFFSTIVHQHVMNPMIFGLIGVASPEAVVSISLLGMCALDVEANRSTGAWTTPGCGSEQLLQFLSMSLWRYFFLWGRKVTFIHAPTFNKDYGGRLSPGSRNLASYWCQPFPNLYHMNCFFCWEDHSFTVICHTSSKGYDFSKGPFPLRIQPSPGNKLPPLLRLGVGLEAAGEIDVKVGWSGYLCGFSASRKPRRSLVYWRITWKIHWSMSILFQARSQWYRMSHDGHFLSLGTATCQKYSTTVCLVAVIQNVSIWFLKLNWITSRTSIWESLPLNPAFCPSLQASDCCRSSQRMCCLSKNQAWFRRHQAFEAAWCELGDVYGRVMVILMPWCCQF